MLKYVECLIMFVGSAPGKVSQKENSFDWLHEEPAEPIEVSGALELAPNAVRQSPSADAIAGCGMHATKFPKVQNQILHAQNLALGQIEKKHIHNYCKKCQQPLFDFCIWSLYYDSVSISKA